MTQNSDLSTAYRVENMPAEYAELYYRGGHPFKGLVTPLPGVKFDDSHAMQQILFDEFGLKDTAECVTCEMKSRPVPHVFRREETKKLTDLYIDWLPDIFAFMANDIRAPHVTFNKESKLGYPYYDWPDNRLEILLRDFELMLAGKENRAGAAIAIGIRRQVDPPTKERDYIFLTVEGQIYAKKVGRNERLIKLPNGSEGVASRTRLIFNMPIQNLLKQNWDSAVHDAFLRHAVFHHDMYHKKMPSGDYHVLALDVKHFERHTAELVHARSQFFGQLYADIGNFFREIPYICVSDDWKKRFLLYPNFADGWAVQFASGDSAVAPAQKEVFLALYANYFSQTRGLTRSAAISFVLSGGDERFSLFNYGDDNFSYGDQQALLDVKAYLEEYLTIEIENPSRFLGFYLRPEDSTDEVDYELTGNDRLVWRLGKRSYLEKTYCPERAPSTKLRPYPNLGWMLKRSAYAEYGDAVISGKIYPREDKLLERIARTSWSSILMRARTEMVMANSSSMKDKRVLTDKEYLITPLEKRTMDGYVGYGPETSAKFIKALVRPELRPHV